MTWLIALMGVPVAATLGVGIWLMLKPRRVSAGWLKGGLLANLALCAVRPGRCRRPADGRAGGHGG